jgi:hypothetical protein
MLLLVEHLDGIYLFRRQCELRITFESFGAVTAFPITWKLSRVLLR